MANARRTILGTNGPERAASVAALTTATGAVACGVCCVLPFAFPAVAVASTGSVLAWFADAHSWATGLAAVIVGGAWIAVAVQARHARARPSRATLQMMALATAALVLAVLWPRIEPHVIRVLAER
jgi:hypothetical protein